MEQYFLATDSFACETDGHAVFLDLKRNRYTAVEPADVPWLRSLIRGWPKPEEPANYEPTPSTNPVVVQQLLGQGVLTSDEMLGKTSVNIDLAPGRETLWIGCNISRGIRGLDLRNFMYAWARITWMLRILPLAHVINRIRVRKSRAQQQTLTVPKKGRIARLTAIHTSLRPLFYAQKDACLRDSLTMIEFLAGYDIHPTLVFGVKMQPFAAHAWVQYENILLNNTGDEIQPYTPIMTV